MQNDDGGKIVDSKLQYIFVHGLSGWGSYDQQYRRMPYWGMRSGDLISFLREEGYDCYAASVSPTGSAWDRACELYAQLAGVRTDYGEAHCSRYRHERYGRDFSEDPLIPSWDKDTRLVLLGHSFGGATVRMLSELMANGNEEERGRQNAGALFHGGMEQHLHSIVALAAPMNGTTAYDLLEDQNFDPSRVKVPWWSNGLSRMLSTGTKPRRDGRDQNDYADYDMHIDHALEMNRRISTLPSVYYFSVPCSASCLQPDGTHTPRENMEPMFVKRSCQIGAYTGRTKGGIAIGREWQENDGLVNTISAMSPEGAPAKPFDRNAVERGIWNVFPTVRGDHMWLQGGLMQKHDIRGFYLDLLRIIESAV